MYIQLVAHTRAYTDHNHARCPMVEVAIERLYGTAEQIFCSYLFERWEQLSITGERIYPCLPHGRHRVTRAMLGSSAEDEGEESKPAGGRMPGLREARAGTTTTPQSL